MSSPQAERGERCQHGIVTGCAICEAEDLRRAISRALDALPTVAEARRILTEAWRLP